VIPRANCYPSRYKKVKFSLPPGGRFIARYLHITVKADRYLFGPQNGVQALKLCRQIIPNISTLQPVITKQKSNMVFRLVIAKPVSIFINLFFT
jgi:hypothetical protein